MEADMQEDLMILKEAILEELNDVEAIYLFGSVARGTYNASSDYDIVVFVDIIPRDKIDRITTIRNKASDRIKRPIDLFERLKPEQSYSSLASMAMPPA